MSAPGPSNPRPPRGVAEPESAVTGLPWPRTWRGVYWLVLGSFVLWVGLLALLSGWFA